MTIEQLGRHSPRVKELRRRVRDRRPGEVIVDGRRLIADLVRWGVPIDELYLADDLAPDDELGAAAAQMWQVEAAALANLTLTRHPQGVLAVVREPAFTPWDGTQGVGLYLENVQDPGNLGGILRCAAGLGAASVLLSPGCVDPFHPTVVRGSAGAVFRVAMERQVPVTTAAERVRAGGGQLWAAATSGTPIHRWRPAEPTLLLIGAEGPGLSATAFEVADGQVLIPLDQGIDSLNVAVATGILLHHLR